MRSMTGYGRGQSTQNGSKISYELNSVNRKQSDVVVTLPRELAELEPRVRDVINTEVARGRLNVVIAAHYGPKASTQVVALDTNLARSYYKAMLDLQKDLNAAGEVSIDTVLRAPGVLRAGEEEEVSIDDLWPSVETALKEALAPWSRGKPYLNFAEKGIAIGDAVGAAAFARLERIKASVDPGKVFRSAHRFESGARPGETAIAA